MKAAEAIARDILAEAYPEYAFEVVDELEARRVVAGHGVAGHALQLAMEERAEVLGVEITRVRTVLDHMCKVLDIGALMAEVDRVLAES